MKLRELQQGLNTAQELDQPVFIVDEEGFFHDITRYEWNPERGQHILRTKFHVTRGTE